MAANRFPACCITFFVAAVLGGCAAGGTDATPSALSAPPTRVVHRRLYQPGAQVRVPHAAAKALYYGGPVTANAKVYVVWWGDPSKINSSVTAAHGGIADFYAGVLNSNYIDWLNEYNTNINAQAGSHMGMAGTGQLIGRGNYAGTFALTNIPSGNVDDSQIQTTLDQALAAGVLPPADDNTLYAIYFPPGVTITIDGSKSCAAFGAYHEGIVETQRRNTYYLVMPDCGDSFKQWTSVSTHELVEAITDNLPTPADMPNYPQAWNDAMGEEVADLCEGSSGTATTPLGSFTVQAIWDERTHSCKSFSSDANDFNVAISPNVATLALNAASTFTVQTGTSTGAAQTLTLSATAPAGVTATVSPTTVTSGGTATLTVTATSPAAPSGLQVVVRADATAGSATQTHTAALLVSITGTLADGGAPPADLAQAPTDLAQAPGDLAQAPGDLAQAPADLARPAAGPDGGAPDDMALSPGTGGTGQPPPAHGCGCVIGSANASGPDGSWAEAAVCLFAFALVALRRRRQSA